MLSLPKEIKLVYQGPQRFTEIQTNLSPNCPPEKEMMAKDAKGTE
jgi:hypothetical protein